MVILLNTCTKELERYSTNISFHHFEGRILAYYEHAKSVLWVMVHVHRPRALYHSLCRILNNFGGICLFSICREVMCMISCNSSQGPWETHGAPLKPLISTIPKDPLKGMNPIAINQRPKKWSRSGLMTSSRNTRRLVASQNQIL